MFDKQQHSSNNQQSVIHSPVLAKAITKRGNRYEIIVVFSKSTRLEFFWIFQARSPRSPQRSWKVVGYSMRDNPTYSDFGSFVSRRALLNGAEILATRMPQRRRLAALLQKCEHESIYSDWSPRDDVILIQDRLRRKVQNNRRGKLAWL